MTGDELVDLDNDVGRDVEAPEEEAWAEVPDEPGRDDNPYTGTEWRAVVTPALVVLVVIALAVFSWYALTDSGPDHRPSKDIDDEGTFNLLGHWREDLTVYGTHVGAINLSLDKGDTVTMTYSSHGPPKGIQVRLQHPLHPTDGTDGTGGTIVYASSVGGNGTVNLFIEEPGAYQVYFWHPGSTSAPGVDDDPNDHTTAAVAYHLVVVRAHRP